MHEQEMQFADPDWKPSGPLSEPQGDVAADAVPRTAASSVYDTGQDASSAPYQQGYRGSLPREERAPVSPIARQETSGSMGATRRQSWWVWLILIVLLISLVSGMSHAFVRSPGRFDPPPFQHSFPHPFPQKQMNTYDLKGTSQISVSNQLGSIVVLAGDGDSNQVIVQTQDGSQPVVTYAGKSMNITTGKGEGADLLITVPRNIALNLNTAAGGIEVDGFAGQLSAQTTYGPITLNYDTLSGRSQISSDSGYIGLQQGSLADSTIIDQRGSIVLSQENLSGQVKVNAGGNGAIAFSGTLDQRGSYQFITDTGDIRLALPDTTSMQPQVSKGSGSYQSDFPLAPGGSPQAAVILQTNSGDITVMKQ
jgi:putative adhesin